MVPRTKPPNSFQSHLEENLKTAYSLCPAGWVPGAFPTAFGIADPLLCALHPICSDCRSPNMPNSALFRAMGQTPSPDCRATLPDSHTAYRHGCHISTGVTSSDAPPASPPTPKEGSSIRLLVATSSSCFTSAHSTCHCLTSLPLAHELHGAWALFCSPFCPQGLEEGLVHGRHSIFVE